MSCQSSTVTTVLTTQHWEDSDLIVMARVRGADAQNIIQAALTSVSIYVFDLSSDEQVGSTATPAVNSVIFDTLQTDDRWTEDEVGYNFRHTIPAEYFPTGGRDYRVEIVFTPTSGGRFPLVVDVSVQNLLSS